MYVYHAKVLAGLEAGGRWPSEIESSKDEASKKRK
jgi:hypothetical protein